MQVSDFLPYLGHSEQNAELSDLLMRIGFDASKMPAKTQRNQCSAFCELKSQGIDLTFYFHTQYRPCFGTPKSEGKAILCCIFVYPNGKKSEKTKPYEGSIPFSSVAVRTRDEALQAFGSPYETQEDDGEIDLDHWRRDELQITARYRIDLTIDHIGFSFPYIGRKQ